MRYHINAHFVEEQKRGFPVHHQLERYTDDVMEVATMLNVFMSSYEQSYCYGLAIGVSEETTIVDDQS